MPPVTGTSGDDVRTISNGSGGMFTYAGNDTLNVVAQPGLSQIHTYAGSGDDVTNMKFNNIWKFSHGHHVRGDEGADTFNFMNLHEVSDVIVGRIEDFNYSEDVIQIEGTTIDLFNLPPYAKIVEYNGEHNDPGADPQQYLLINTSAGGQVFYALEGARVDMTGNGGANSGDQENHFVLSAPNFSQLQEVDYIDQVNYVPVSAVAQGGMTINDTDVKPSDVTDIIYGGSQGDLIAAGLNDDTVYAGDGNDQVWGGSGHDDLYGGTGNDIIEGGTGDDLVRGELGNDSLSGGHGDDRVYGGGGNDSMYGNVGDDRLWGEDGSDLISGDAGDDRIWAGAQDDDISGGSGNDLLSGGAGRDVASGGTGNDTFSFATGDLIDWGATSGTTAQRFGQVDLIDDFVIGEDLIQFDDFTSNAGKQIDGMEDLSIFKTTLDGNVHFTVKVIGSDERILVDVDDNTSWSQFANSDNFDFIV